MNKPAKQKKKYLCKKNITPYK